MIQPAMHHRMSQYLYSAGPAQDSPASAHAVYGLLNHKQLMSWIATDSSSFEQLCGSLQHFLADMTEREAIGKTAILAAACVLNIWRLVHTHISEFGNQDNIKMLFLVMKCVQATLEVSCILCKQVLNLAQV